MDWKEIYESRKCTADEAVKRIKSGDHVVTAHDVGEPPALIEALIRRRDSLRNVEISHMVNIGKTDLYNPEYKESFHPNLWFLGGPTRKCVEMGTGDFTPLFFYEVPGLMRDGTIPVDVALVMVTPPDEHGFVSTGVSGDYTVQAMKSAKLVIAQVNDQLPFTFGDGVFSVKEIDAFVEESRELPTLPPAKIGPVEEAIGKNCAQLIRDGDTLQLGIGAIPDAVCHQLKEKKHLGIHSELLTDGVVDLYEAGVIDNSCKAIDRGKFVFNFVMGSQKLYDFCHRNPVCQMRGVDYVNHPMVIAQNTNMVSINSGIGVDFYGQVASDTIGYRQFSGVGGQVDFIRGTTMTADGKGRAIIAMPSTTKKNDGSLVSKITPLLAEGQVVTASRHDVDYVVTENGIARLKGKTVKDRARALIGIAHPEFQEELKAGFEKMFGTAF